jgi:glycosyltransferase involved in cell wall biosynthesis
VVIPCYNDGAVVTEAIDSVEAALGAIPRSACEVVVVDDGSDDPNTLAVLAGLSDEIAVVRQRNSGLSAARMAGVRATTAPLIHPLDADDRLAAGALEALVSALDEDDDAQIAWGDTKSFGARECLYRKAAALDPWRITFLSEVPATCLLRRSLLDDLGGWELTDAYEDWDLWMKLAAQGVHGVYVGRVTLLYREHSQPRMYRKARDRHDELRALLRARHETLFKNRRHNRRRSDAPTLMKLLFGLVDRLPLVSGVNKERAWVRIRNFAEPELRPICGAQLRRYEAELARHG